LGFGHVVSKFPNKKVMVLKANNEVEIDEEDKKKKMSPLKDVNDIYIKYLVNEKTLVVKRALNLLINMDVSEG
jgi:hypothetical protein